VLLVKQEPLTLPEHIFHSRFFSGRCCARSSVFFVVHCSFVFWLPHWFLQTFFGHVLFLTPISQILFNIYLVTFLLQSPSEISLWNGHVLYLYVIIVDIRFSVSLCPNWRYAVTGAVLIVKVCWTYTTYAMSGYHHWCCEFESRSGRGVQHYVIKFVSDLRQVGGFLRVLRFPPPIELTATI
jgi:hypothetical protein